MKQSMWARGNVRCPFWRGDWDKAVACEGPFDGCGVTVTFCSQKMKWRQMEVFCADHFRNCEVYRMVRAAKYDE